ncbi:MAG: nucleoside 2-deoxyribosyltransferase [Vicinamibacterales bacterium]
MRVYLACTVRGDRAGVAAGRAIAERLEALGHEVLTKHLLVDEVESNEAKLTDEAIYRRDLDWVSSCDLLIAEASGSSYGVGFEVGFVLGRSGQSGQRVLVLYDVARRRAVSRLITGNAHPACRTTGYASLDELRSAVDRFLTSDS